jgi:hypothetical protein
LAQGKREKLLRKAFMWVETLEPRTLLSGDGRYSGVVESVFLQNGQPRTAALADAAVYADMNLNGFRDSGEPYTRTDLDGSFSITLDPDTVFVLRVDHKAGWAAAGDFPDTAPAIGGGGSVGTLYSAPAFPVTIDVLAVYTPAAAGAMDGPPNEQIREWFIAANRIYHNSNTNVVLNPVSIVQVEYQEANRIGRDLDRLRDRGDGYLDDVHTLRNELNADLVVLFTDLLQSSGDTLGLAFQYKGNGDSTYGFAVVAADPLDDDEGSTLAHEIGHLLGAGHDKSVEDSPTRPYALGYRFVGDDGETYLDVMSYGIGIELTFFSTPEITYAGKPIGRSDRADNVRMIRQAAPKVASYRGAPVSGSSPPDLVAAVTVDTVLVTEHTATIKVKIRNVGNSTAKKKIDTQIVLSADNVVDEGDVLIGRLSQTSLKLKSGKSKTFTVKVRLDGSVPTGSWTAATRWQSRTRRTTSRSRPACSCSRGGRTWR